MVITLDAKIQFDTGNRQDNEMFIAIVNQVLGERFPEAQPQIIIEDYVIQKEVDYDLMMETDGDILKVKNVMFQGVGHDLVEGVDLYINDEHIGDYKGISSSFFEEMPEEQVIEWLEDNFDY